VTSFAEVRFGLRFWTEDELVQYLDGRGRDQDMISGDMLQYYQLVHQELRRRIAAKERVVGGWQREGF